MLALAPLHKKFGVKSLGYYNAGVIRRGYPGVPSMDIIDNVIPYISGEEDKVEQEPNKIFGALTGTKVKPASIIVSSTCTRVNVLDGHLESVSVELEKNRATSARLSTRLIHSTQSRA